MRLKNKLFLTSAAVAIVATAAFGVASIVRSPSPVALSNKVPTIPLLDIFYARGNFLDAQAAVAKTMPERGVRAVVVPHHLLASRLVADALRRASGTKYKTIIVVGPNHDDRGPDMVSSSAVSYETPYGTVWPDEEKVAAVRTLFADRSDYTAFRPEHSVGAMIPTIALDFPGAKIVPIILSSRAKANETSRLADWLAGLSADTLVVFSVDFSHYLIQDQAEAKDAETAKALASRDIETISKWGNDHIDSPYTIVTMIKFANKIGAAMETVKHANANDFLPVKALSTTSYFELIVK